MSDEMKMCTEEECDCKACTLVRKIGYADVPAWASALLQPCATSIVDTLDKARESLLQKRVSGVITPEEASDLMGMARNMVIQQLLHLASKIAHLNGVSIGSFCGNAAEHWNSARSPFAQLVPIPEGVLRDLLENMFGGQDPFCPPEEEKGKAN